MPYKKYFTNHHKLKLGKLAVLMKRDWLTKRIG